MQLYQIEALSSLVCSGEGFARSSGLIEDYLQLFTLKLTELQNA
jgi:hypothetical protein